MCPVRDRAGHSLCAGLRVCGSGRRVQSRGGGSGKGGGVSTEGTVGIYTERTTFQVRLAWERCRGGDWLGRAFWCRGPRPSVLRRGRTVAPFPSPGLSGIETPLGLGCPASAARAFFACHSALTASASPPSPGNCAVAQVSLASFLSLPPPALNDGGQLCSACGGAWDVACRRTV